MDPDISENILIQKKWFIKSLSGNIEDHYVISTKQTLGQGNFGSVFKVKHKATKFNRAVKRIPKSKVVNKQRLINQIEAMRALDHPNIIRLFQTFEDNKYVYLVMELCEGGELFQYLIEKETFDESQARNFFKQIVQGVAYCHAHGVVHRDLKPQNFLRLHKSDDSAIKIIDFGLSALIGMQLKAVNKKTMKTKAGTPYYISPQVLQGSYDQACDVWSLGVILYVLLAGTPPFFGETQFQIFERVKKRSFSFDIPQFNSVNPDAKDLIVRCLSPVQTRIKTHEILAHPWLNNEKVANPLQKNLVGLKDFVKFSQIKKIVLSFFACQLNESDFGKLGEVFKKLDKNGDGFLTVEEINLGLNESQIEKISELNSFLESAKGNKAWKLNYTQFLASCMDKSIFMRQERMINTFKMLDADNSGRIDKVQLKRLLGNQPEMKGRPEEFWDNLIKEADKNGDGQIDYQEFVDMLFKTEGLMKK